MRITKTIRAHNRAEIAGVIQRLCEGARVVFMDPERTDPQAIKLRLMREEIARRILWHGEKLSAADWKVMFAAALRGARVVDGIDPGTRVALGVREDGEPSLSEASDLIEMMRAFCAERGVILE